MMNSDEELERYRNIGRLVELIHKMSEGRMKKLLGQLETRAARRKCQRG